MEKRDYLMKRSVSNLNGNLWDQATGKSHPWVLMMRELFGKEYTGVSDILYALGEVEK